MTEAQTWDWELGEKSIEPADWTAQFQWMEEFQVSPDGESIGAVVNIDEAQFTVCVNGRTWPNPLEKIWHLRFSANGTAYALVCEEGEWTVALDGQLWENRFGYAWHPMISGSGSHLAVAVDKQVVDLPSGVDGGGTGGMGCVYCE